MIKRYLERYIFDDLKDKMVFVSGPRQVGKATLAKQIGENFFSEKYEYLNWDNRADKKIKKEGYNELSDKIGQLKLMSSEFRLIQSISSPKAESFKLWLARVGYERVKEIEDPELATKRTRTKFSIAFF